MGALQGYLLIVEDDSDIRALLDTTLRFRGHRVATANNGREALELIHKEHPILVIADIMMPQLDGFGLVHRLRIHPETRMIPVVFITATYVAPEDRVFALRIGATPFLKTVEELIGQGPHTIPEPLDEFRFYDGYRERLEAKFNEKVKQIARDQYLLNGRQDACNQDIQVSLRQTVRESEELKGLLEEIHKQLERIRRKESGRSTT